MLLILTIALVIILVYIVVIRDPGSIILVSKNQYNYFGITSGLKLAGIKPMEELNSTSVRRSVYHFARLIVNLPLEVTFQHY